MHICFCFTLSYNFFVLSSMCVGGGKSGEEAFHYSLWRDRLKEMNSCYGALPVHDGLWKCALETRDDILARLAIVHMVLEGRGLDVEPSSIQKLVNAKDEHSANLLKTISKDEITHVGSGVRWFRYVCENQNPPVKDPIAKFQQIVKERFRGNLKPPFNTKARDAAGFAPEWYLPLAK
ncbi:hypothetical protein RFI_08443 [Reticulomyxa filosa]|uniref:Uncharacterized protein n=1 Tax=Reticulomyxa filosa TaxID=46433 RepID=X6NSG0_RETFI|nr:hypothetical protein RFI_08443 [Reticulomyxa filosa]|eukprot:ETO28689.1 hypothetical protein RFI_08443 [Reticulomyxa filosa]